MRARLSKILNRRIARLFPAGQPFLYLPE